MILKTGFVSDNNSGIHPEILHAIEKANQGHCIAYGEDPFTEAALKKFKEHFGDNIDVYFVFTGTGANVLGIRAVTQSFESVICSEISHINLDECAAPENFTGCKLVAVKTDDGKFSPEDVKPLLAVKGDEHSAQPKVISITQATELGTVYTQREVITLANFAHSHDMFLHMDGARISNAAASLGLSLREITGDAGVDVLSFGGTKNGMMIGEAVIFFNKKSKNKFKFIRKQGMQLASKMRFISVQFEAFLTNDLWLRNALHANRMAKLLAAELEKIPGCTITQKVEANAVFIAIAHKYIDKIQKEFFFNIWEGQQPVIRLMTSFNTKEEDIQDLIQVIKKIVES